MANFKGVIKGARGKASRLGHSRLDGRVAGWNVGVSLTANRTDAGDAIYITADSGNAGDGSRMEIGQIIETSTGPVFIPSPVVRSQCRSLDAAAD